MKKGMALSGKWIDITQELAPGIPVYPGDPEYQRDPVSRISAGDACNLSRITMGSHTGTHVDAPRHLFEAEKGVDQLPWESFLGEAKVLDVTDSALIPASRFHPEKIRRGDILLLKTIGSSLPESKCQEDRFPALSAEAAQFLSDRQIRTLGIDRMSVDPPGSTDLEVHRILLKAGIVIIEGLELSAVTPGRYRFYALPLRIRDGDGAPLRAVLQAY